MIWRAAEEAERNQQVLAVMERVLKADTRVPRNCNSKTLEPTPLFLQLPPQQLQ
jgi:uncharacterized protein (UPF0147 family)